MTYPNSNKSQKNPILTLKTSINKRINKINKNKLTKIFKPISGEYAPGYIYGTVKIHKENNQLRPIISQIPTPTYDIVKQLNAMITPYLPSKYIIKING